MNQKNQDTMTPVFDAAPIQLTSGAIKELKQLLYEKNAPEGYGVRVGVKGGGCSGMSYIIGFDAKKDTDLQFEVDGLTVYLNKAHSMYLLGMEVDYVSGLQNRGFTFTNPNATSTCGCGTSFSA